MNQQEREELEWEIDQAMRVLGLLIISISGFFSILFIGLIISRLVEVWTFIMKVIFFGGA